MEVRIIHTRSHAEHASLLPALGEIWLVSNIESELGGFALCGVVQFGKSLVESDEVFGTFFEEEEGGFGGGSLSHVSEHY